MSGQPKRQKIKAELERLAAKAEVDSALSFVELWLESGDTLFDLCGQLALVVGERVYAGSVERLLLEYVPGGFEELRRRLGDARRKGASVMAEEARAIADASDPTPGAVAQARARGDFRFRLAEAWDRERFGSKAAGITIDIGQLHLSALREVNAQRLAARATVDTALLTPTTTETDADFEETE